MADIVAPIIRSRMMSGIRSKNTRPEMLVRNGLHAAGFRYRLHRRDLPGTPDITLPKYRGAIFVNGCFWHGHDCPLFKWPATRTAFWVGKIGGNQRRDADARVRLLESTWRRLVIWECSLRGRNKRDFDSLMQEVIEWIRSDCVDSEISGR